jgi:hypothetical protein
MIDSAGALSWESPTLGHTTVADVVERWVMLTIDE